MHSIRIRIWPKQQRAMKTNKNKSSNPCPGLSPWVHHSWYQLTMVRGWWSAISIILPWSGVGSQLLTSSSHDLGWWSAINIIKLWSGFGGQYYFVPQSTTRGYSILQSTTQYYSILQSTTRYVAVLQSTTRHSQPEPGIEPGTPLAFKAHALSSRQIFWADHTRKVFPVSQRPLK